MFEKHSNGKMVSNTKPATTKMVLNFLNFSTLSQFFIDKKVVQQISSSTEFNFGDDFVHQVIGITSRCQACSKVFNVLLKHNFGIVCPQETNPFFNACWVAAVVVCVLKCFSRFVKCAHVENRFFLESLSLIDCCVHESCF